MDDEPRGRVAFDPVRLTNRRRRFDPVLIGALAVVIGLAAAIVKPWPDDRVEATRTDSPPSLVSPAATSDRSASPPPPILMAESDRTLVAAVQHHDGWGISAIVAVPGGRSAVREDWIPIGADRVGQGSDIGVTEPTIIGDGHGTILALGITTPATWTAVATRVWRPTADGDWEWLDTPAIAGGVTDGPNLLLPPRIDGVTPRVWPSGQFRLEVLLGDAVQDLAIALPSRFERIPRPTPASVAPPNLLDPVPLTLEGVTAGIFAIVDRHGLALPAASGSDRVMAQAWRTVLGRRPPGPSVPPGAGSPSSAPSDTSSPVSLAYLPRATGLGVLLPDGAQDARASIRRLDASGRLDGVTPIIGSWINLRAVSPYVVFAAPLGGAWRAGTYAIDATWADAGGHQAGSWSVELRPGP